MDGESLELVISEAADRPPLRVTIAKDITTVGADPQADVCLPGRPVRWLVVEREGGGLAVRALAGGGRQRLSPGDELVVDGVRISCEVADAGLSLDAVAASLAAAGSPEDALERILSGVVAA